MSDKSLSQLFDVEPNAHQLQQQQEVLPSIDSTDADDINEDYHLARNTLHTLIEKGEAAIDDVHFLAKDTESPRAYEVLATLLKNVGDTTKELMALQKITREIRGARGVPSSVHIDKAVFVGTAADLLRQVKPRHGNSI